MLVDVTRFPIVFIRSGSTSEEAVPSQIEHLLDREAPFVLMTDHAPGDHDDESAEERKEKALFVKKIKSRLVKLCKAMIVIEGDQPTNAIVRAGAATAAKAFGFSVFFVADEEQANQKAELILAAIAP